VSPVDHEVEDLPMNTIPDLPPLMYEGLVRNALAEDLGRAGDLTTDAIVPATAAAVARVVVRSGGRVAGVAPAAAAFRLLDDRCTIEIAEPDGREVAAGDIVLTVRGPARAVLTAERTALNLLGRLCGIATLTDAFVRQIDGTGARVSCTRKTTPGLRALEKHAVRCGGGVSHRFGLDDAVLIKDNHLAVAGGVRQAVERARSAVGHLVCVELEVDTLEQLAEGLEVGVDAVLLDNMDPSTLERAVAMVAGRCTTEASGGITLATARSIAETGVDLLSVGALTHSAPSLDVSLEID
jgi:nicotinate-nucleotide pyrophosphorylase (carboxylating)